MSLGQTHYWGIPVSAFEIAFAIAFATHPFGDARMTSFELPSLGLADSRSRCTWLTGPQLFRNLLLPELLDCVPGEL